MTTLTPSTAMTHIPEGPPSWQVLMGSLGGVAAFGLAWTYVGGAGSCMASPLDCIRHPSTADPLGLAVLGMLAFTFVGWLFSLRTIPTDGISDCSIIDRFWSILPPTYALFWCILSGKSARTLFMTAVAIIWGMRLTLNFWIKGGYSSGGEDYRWAVVRQWYKGVWELFNLIFVCVFQQCLLLGIATPAATAMRSQEPWGLADSVLAVAAIGLLLGEAVADRQMLAYQTEKYRRKGCGEDPGPYQRGFIETGLWAYSRHPNYFCEVSFWWVFYGFSVTSTGQLLNWTLPGPLFLSGLFLAPKGSLDLAEALSSAKYPAYVEYQRRVSAFVPWFPNQSTKVNGESAKKGD